MKLDELVNKNYENLNENDHYIWQYITNHRQECENLSIDKLAKKCHVSRSTILRFSKRLGLKGFVELKVLLKIDNQLQATKLQPDSVYREYSKVLQNLQNNLYLEIVQKIYQAKNLYVYGTGEIQESIAQHLKRSFLRVEKLFLDIDTAADLEAYLSLYETNDVFFAISYSGENKRLIDYIYRLKAMGVIIVTIVANLDSTLAHISNYSLLIEEVELTIPDNSQETLLGSGFVMIDFLFANYIEYVKGVQR